MSEVRPARDVSCLALTFFFDYLQTQGVPRARLLEGLGHPPEYFEQRTNWLDYATFLAIERRLAELLPGDAELFFHVGQSFGGTRGFGFLRPIFRSVLSPAQLYALLPRLVGRFLFPFVSIRLERRGLRNLWARYDFAPGFPPSTAFLDTVRGILTTAPTMLGLAPARVQMRRLSPLSASFDICLQRPRGAALGGVRELPGRLLGAGRRLWRNLGDVVVELEETNHLLQEKVEALTEAKAELDLQVASLSLLHALTHAGATHRHLGRLLDEVVRLLSGACGEGPAAVLLSEGEPPRGVLAATRGLPLESQLALVEAPAVQEALEVQEQRLLALFGGALVLMPMVCRGQAVGVLALAEQAWAGRGELLATVASEVAVLVDNAVAFRTIADLRDNLEVRVQERTAELEEAQGQLEETVERLRQSDRSRSEFFTNVSHELRTPLTLILAPLDSLEETLARAGVAGGQDVHAIRQNARLLLRHIDEILDFARLDADRMPLQVQTLELRGLLEESVTTLLPLARARRVSLSCRPPEEALCVALDPRLARRVLFNLLVNAIKYVRAGDTVRVGVGGVTEEGVVVQVADSGPGVAPEHRARIFERFQRVPDGEGRTIEGSGLGLAMVKEIVELHGGRVEVGEAEGGGAVFSVHLPRARATHPAGASPSGASGGQPEQELAWLLAETRRSATPGVPAPEAPTSGGRLLLVEDNAQMRAFLVRLLGRQHALSWAADGEEGLARAREELPDLVVSDVMLPGLDGYGLCRQLKAEARTQHIPVLLLSARHGTEAALEGFRAGADDYVVKPFSAPELLARVQAQLRLRAMAAALARMEKQTALGVLSAGVAHEVLNPINAVVNAVAPLRRGLLRLSAPAPVPGEVEALLGTVERGGQRVRTIVQTLLSLSQEPGGRMPLREVALAETLEPALALLAPRLADRVHVHRDYGWDGPLACAPELLGQVVMNLVANAADALGPGGGNVWLSTERLPGAVRIRVRDDGPGVRPELRERIFDAFFTTKAPGAGTGMGLALARQIASLHGGSLCLGDAREGGAEFLLTLPLQGEQALQAASSEVSP